MTIMKIAAYYLIFVVAGYIAGFLTAAAISAVSITNVQYKPDGWTVTVPIPTCKPTQNIQVIFPPTPTGNVSIECFDLPTPVSTDHRL